MRGRDTSNVRVGLLLWNCPTRTFEVLVQGIPTTRTFEVLVHSKFECRSRAPFVEFCRAKASGECGVRSDVGKHVCCVSVGQGVRVGMSHVCVGCHNGYV